jgi:hypothetical protein
MTLDQRARAVATRQDFVAFLLRALHEDHRKSRSVWPNDDLAAFLEALAGWGQDMDGFYEDADAVSPWRNAAEALLAARFYE